ncbi:ATPase [Thalassomonas viridans]|uniref:ATPase n=1 Tax=Thalassomonas viridans TaxID=137584 RepID=A0AAE9Z8V1_9GAMM|nr:BadF/BadG/BcrA/BcrD ATPase family protein [Thalassomonas viridans]WDE07217.1 ATPase [Thalassomonas viridans]
MLYTKDEQEKLFLGIDGGGSKCKAIIMTADNQILGSGVSGPGNPLHGFEQAKDSIVKASYLALMDAGLTDIPLNTLIAGVGLAGVNLPQQFRQMSAWQHPFKEMFLATDLLVACLGAHQGQDGAVMITGTGSCGFSYVRGQEFIVGAHGFPHGDKGSGGWFGLQAVEQVLLSLDGFKPASELTRMLMDKLECSTGTDIVEAVAGKPAVFYAGLANLVFDVAEQGDALALAIVHEGGAYISKVARRLWQQEPPAMSIIGGLSVRLMPWLDQEIRDRLRAPVSPPEVGSVLFARQQQALLAECAVKVNH